jgi:hypothetical protein
MLIAEVQAGTFQRHKKNGPSTGLSQILPRAIKRTFSSFCLTAILPPDDTIALNLQNL